MSAKRRATMSLGEMKAAKGTAPAPTSAATAAAKPAGGARKGQTLRLSPAAWMALKILALDLSRARTDGKVTSVHDLLIEGVNDVFAKHGKPRIA